MLCVVICSCNCAGGSALSARCGCPGVMERLHMQRLYEQALVCLSNREIVDAS